MQICSNSRRYAMLPIDVQKHAWTSWVCKGPHISQKSSMALFMSRQSATRCKTAQAFFPVSAQQASIVLEQP